VLSAGLRARDGGDHCWCVSGFPLLALLGVPVVLAQGLGLTAWVTLCAVALVAAFLWVRGRVALIGDKRKVWHGD